MLSFNEQILYSGASVLVVLKRNASSLHPVVPSGKPFRKIDLSAENFQFNESVYLDFRAFNSFIEDLKKDGSILFGGYAEERSMYRRSTLFDGQEPRTIHLGIDIWSDAGTPVYAPLGGMIHSLAFNNNNGDYGATIILQHQIEAVNFYILYGHLSLADLEKRRKGEVITRGEVVGHFGNPSENGNWPPHLHLQIICDIGNHEGDFPGVCARSKMPGYLSNCPDPAILLGL